MSNPSDIQFKALTGLTLYTMVVTPTGQYFRHSSSVQVGVEAYDPSHRADYAVALFEPVAKSGFYFGSVPHGLQSGLWLLPVYKQAGGAVADADQQLADASSGKQLTLVLDWCVDRSGSRAKSIAPLGSWPTGQVQLPAAQSSLAAAQAILAELYQSRLAMGQTNVVSITIDGEQTVFSSPGQLETAILFWERRVAILSGKRRRAATIRLDGF
jgi:hypothetical protein